MHTDRRWLGERRWEPWAGLGGILFVALAVLWAALTSDVPNVESSDSEIASFYNDSGNRARVGLAGFALSIGGVFLLWFLGSLRSILRRAEGGAGRLSAVAFGAGVAMAALLFVKVAVSSSLPGAFEYGDRFELDPNLARYLDTLSFWLLANEAVAGGVLVAATSVVALRTGVFPRWLAWAGLPVAVLGFLAVPLFAFPIVLIAAWILALSAVILRGARRRPPARTAPET